jgi:serine O-acetyltransferase
MSFKEFITLLTWDLRVNKGLSLDSLRAKLFLIEFRLEQYAYRNLMSRPSLAGKLAWFTLRFLGSLLQWFLCHSNMPGTLTIGRGLRLPHPQNIIIAGLADIGEFCTIYHNVSIAWNGFKPIRPLSPKIGSGVLIGAGTIIVGDITIGSNVLIGAGAVVSQSVPDYSRVTSVRAVVTPRYPSEQATEPGSEQHLNDPYSIWR